MRRCWIAAKADYRPCLSSCTQHRDHWMRSMGECAHKIFFQKPESTASPPAYSQCRATPPATSKHYQVLPCAANRHGTAHRPQGVTVPLHWFAGCPSSLVPRCGVPGARPAAEDCGAGTGHRLPPPSHGTGAGRPPACRNLLPALERRDLAPVARHPAAADTLPARRMGFNVGTHRARERTAVRGLARSSTGAASPFARCVSCPPCSRKFS